MKTLSYILGLLGLAALILKHFKKLQDKIDELNKEREQVPKLIKNAREDALNRQRIVIKGQLTEELFPLMQGCPWLASDMKFWGDPIDYCILDGMTEAKDGDGDIREVIFADVKTGEASLSPHQRKIKKAVDEGRVSWVTIKVGANNEVKLIKSKKKTPKKEKEETPKESLTYDSPELFGLSHADKLLNLENQPE